MAKITAILLFIFLVPWSVSAADITYEIKRDSIDFVMTFQSAPANVTMLKGEKDVVFNFDTSEPVSFTRQDFFDLPIRSAYVASGDSYRKKFIITFDGPVIEPKVTASGKRVVISVPIAADLLATPAIGDNITTERPKQAVPGAGSYFRMIFGLMIVLVVILGLYWFLKTYLKKRVLSDIPGSGRLLGRVDLDIRKSLYFYEIGETIYIIGVTDSSMSLIDKVSDGSDMTKIKSGLAKKSEFNGYMTFFDRKSKSGLNEDMSAGSTLIEEKIKSLRKK